MPTVAIVDNNASCRAWAKRSLSLIPGVQVRCYEHGPGLLRDLDRFPPDLCLVDYRMPGLDGLSLLHLLRHHRATERVPVTLVTGTDQPELVSTALLAGAVDVLFKPMNSRQLRLKVGNLLRSVAGRTTEAMACTASSTVQALIGCLERIAKSHDEATGRHTSRIAQYAVAIGRELGLSEQEQAALLLAAPLHDMGKIGVSLALLHKPGELTSLELAEMRRHPRIGHDILAHSNIALLDLAADIALRHHEKWDGSGYPDGLRANEIPLAARIVAVADVFDALTSVRPYKLAWSMEATVQTIREASGSHFDPNVIAAFERALPHIEAEQRRLSDRRVV